MLLNIEKLRSQPEIVAPEYFQNIIQEFNYIPYADQVLITVNFLGSGALFGLMLDLGLLKIN